MLTVGARPKRPAKRHAAVLTHTICGGKVGIDRQGRSSGEHIARGVWAVDPGHSGVRCLRVEDDKKLIPVQVAGAKAALHGARVGYVPRSRGNRWTSQP